MPETKEDPFPNLRDKWLIVLQQSDLFPNLPQVAVVVASSIKPNRRPDPAPFRIFVGPDEVFEKESVIDGRWVFTFARSRILGGTWKGSLDEVFMKRVSGAVAVGLDLTRPGNLPRRPR